MPAGPIEYHLWRPDDALDCLAGVNFVDYGMDARSYFLSVQGRLEEPSSRRIYFKSFILLLKFGVFENLVLRLRYSRFSEALAVADDKHQFCYACYTGDYPTELVNIDYSAIQMFPKDSSIGKISRSRPSPGPKNNILPSCSRSASGR